MAQIFTVNGKAVRDLNGLQTALLAANFLVLFSDSRENPAATMVHLDDAEAKDPTAVVMAFVDNLSPESKAYFISPDGSRWMMTVNNAGAPVVSPA